MKIQRGVSMAISNGSTPMICCGIELSKIESKIEKLAERIFFIGKRGELHRFTYLSYRCIIIHLENVRSPFSSPHQIVETVRIR